MTDTLTTATKAGDHANKSKLALFIHHHASAMDQLANIAGLLIGLSNIDANEKNSALGVLNDIKETAANHIVSADDIAAQIAGAASGVTAPHVVLTPAGQPIPLLTTTADVEAAQAKAARKAALQAELDALGE